MRHAAAALALLCAAGAAHAEGPVDEDALRAEAREIYARVIGFDSSVEGGQTMALAQYLAGVFAEGGFAAEDIHLLPLAESAALVVRYRGDGTGGPGFTLRDEVGQRPYGRGTVGIALAGKDTGGSQLFVALSPQPHLDGTYPVLGWVAAGMEVVDRVQPGDVIERVEVWTGAGGTAQ